MMSYKVVVFILIATFAQVASAGVQCPKSIGVEGYKLQSCKNYAERTVLTYKNTSIPAEDDAFSHLPIHVVVSKKGFGGSAAIGRGMPPITAFSFPFQDQVDRRIKLNDSAARKLAISGWVVNGEVIVYRAKLPEAGMIVVCSRASKELRQNYVAVYQCSSFYEKDIKVFHKVLKYVEGAVAVH